MSRAFDGASSITLGIGGLTGWTGAGMGAWLIKRAASNEMVPGSIHDSDSPVYALDCEAGVTDYLGDGVFAAAGVAIPVNVWCAVFLTKAAGSAVPRLHTFRYDTSAWGHNNMGASVADGGVPGAGGEIRIGDYNNGPRFNGLEAAMGFWPPADIPASDAALEALGLEAAIQNWLDYGAPLGAWKLDQASTSDPVLDLTGGGADQTAIVGTTVSADDPPGFDYTVSAATTPVGRDLPTAWDVHGLAGRDAPAAWDVLAAVAQAAPLGWDTRALVGRDAPVTFDTRTLAGRDAALAWNTRALAGRDVALAFAVRALAGRDVATAWQVLAHAGRDAVLRWNVLGPPAGAPVVRAGRVAGRWSAGKPQSRWTTGRPE